MWVPTETLIQALILLSTLVLGILLHRLPRTFTSHLRRRSTTTLQSRRHFLLGADLLSGSNPSPSQTHSALHHATLAASLDPRDAAPLILKSLALDRLGRRSAAIRCLDSALSPPAVRSLGERERGDAMVRRAEMRRRRKVGELEEAVGLSPGNGKGLCLLAEAYEAVGRRTEAREMFERASGVADRGIVERAEEGLRRLDGFDNSNSKSNCNSVSE